MLSQEFSSVYFQEKTLKRNSMLQTSLGELRDHWNHLYPLASSVHALHPICSLHKHHVLWDEAPARHLACQCKAGDSEAHHQLGTVEALICTWSAHAEERTQRYGTNTQEYTGRKERRRQGQLQLGSQWRSLRVLGWREAPQLVQNASTYADSKDGDVCPGWNVPKLRLDKHVVSGGTFSPPRSWREPGKPVGYREQSQWREKDEKAARLEEVHYWRCHTLTRTATSSVSKLFRLPPHPP